jgi:hypothetical protein
LRFLYGAQSNDIKLAKDELLDLYNNQKLHFDFKSVKLDKFWRKHDVAHPILTK